LNHPGVEFVVVGDGPLGDETRARAASVPAIRFAGWRRDIAPVLSGLDIVVLCSDNEGIPLSLIEASACGTPIAATNVGSVSDVVIDGTNGLLVQPTVDALAEGVSRLLADEQLRVRLGAEGKRVASERFSITAAQERHRAMYRKLVSGR
ncbi:MAG: glycosyltransferase, partial [Ilumatobacteraceae bacterium]